MNKKKEQNILAPLVDSMFYTTMQALNSTSSLLCKAIGIKTKEEREEEAKRIEEYMKRKQEEELSLQEQAIENINKITIGNKKLNFNELFFNCGLKNKLKDMPLLKKVNHYETVDIYSFKLPVGVTISSVKDKIEHLADFFEVSQMNIKLQKKNGLMDIIITKDDLFNRVFEYQDMKLSEGLKIPLGHFVNQDYLEKMLVIDMAKDEIPHAFIGSTTGGGKSNFIRVMLLNWIMNKKVEDIELYLIDGKGGTDYVAFLEAPHVFMNKCFKDEEDIITILEDAHREILRRNQTFIQAKANNFKEYIELGNKMARRVIVFDEYAMYHGTSDYNVIQSKVSKICSTGRSAGVHIIIATQDARKEILDSMIKYNMPLKIGFKCDNAQHSKNISGHEGLETINKIGVGRAYGLPIDSDYIQFKTMKSPSSKNIRTMIHNKYKYYKKEEVVEEDMFFGEECED